MGKTILTHFAKQKIEQKKLISWKKLQKAKIHYNWVKT